MVGSVQLEYGLPMDDQELDRIDLCHAKYYALLEKRRYLAPITESPQRIVDLGCGTGKACFVVDGVAADGCRHLVCRHSR